MEELRERGIYLETTTDFNWDRIPSSQGILKSQRLVVPRLPDTSADLNLQLVSGLTDLELKFLRPAMEVLLHLFAGSGRGDAGSLVSTHKVDLRCENLDFLQFWNQSTVLLTDDPELVTIRAWPRIAVVPDGRSRALSCPKSCT